MTFSSEKVKNEIQHGKEVQHNVEISEMKKKHKS